MSLSKESKEKLRKAIATMAKRFVTVEETSVTDFHFQANTENGNLTIFDDDDHLLAQTHIAEWEQPDDDQCHCIIERELRSLLTEAQKNGTLDNMNVSKPYSCILVDEEKETIVDLLYIDDDTYILTNDLLEGFDEEMNDFLKKLLEE